MAVANGAWTTFYLTEKNKQYTSESVVTLFRTKHYDYDQSG